MPGLLNHRRLLQHNLLHTQLEETNTHKSAKIHADNVFVTRHLLLTKKINGFPGLIVEHF